MKAEYASVGTVKGLGKKYVDILNENGIYTIDLDVMDDADNTITMEWSGVLVDQATISLPGQNAAVRKVATDKRASMKFVR